MTPEAERLKIRKACVEDAARIQVLVNRQAEEGKMLALSLPQIYEGIRDFAVAEEEGKMIGACALRVLWEDLAEIRSLAVDPCCRDLGVGRALVESCLEEARSLHLRRVFALTYQEDFFRRMGFGTVDKSTLPQKVWGDCMRCTKFPDCDETAVIRELPEG